jgi:outer membrane usher protein FimD/PapC
MVCAQQAPDSSLTGRPPADGPVLPQPSPTATNDSSSRSAEMRPEQFSQLVVSVRLNGVAKGDFIVYTTPDGDFLFAPGDLEAMGISRTRGRFVEIAGRSHLSMKSIDGAQIKFDEKRLSLDIQLPPGMLPSQRLNLGATLPGVPIQSRAPGGFLNYRFGYSRGGGIESYNGATELGVNLGEFLLLDNRIFSRDAAHTQGIRLQTQLVYDQPEALRRWAIGDSLASSGELGSSLNLGGLSVSKLYQMNPYIIKQPLAAYSGAIALPSTVAIYMDGALLRSEKVAPGNFNLQNLNYVGGPGLRNVDVVVRDPFGREERISFPYFFSDQLLARGLHEYSYNAGFIRRNYGVASNDYGTFAVSAFHRYGWSDVLTAGLGGDATRDHFNFGPRASINTVKAGVIAGGIAVSRDGSTGTSGTAASIAHTFTRGAFSTQILARRFSENYSVIGFSPADKPRLERSLGISYGNRDAGTFSLSQTVQTVYGGATDQNTITFGYSRTLARNVSLAANLSRVTQVTSGYAAFISISFFPRNDLTANVSHQKAKDGGTSDQVQFNKVVPTGEGLGYRMVAERSVNSGVIEETISPFIQYNARDAMLTAEGTEFVRGGAGFYQLTIAGAATYIGNGLHLSRPINDSYGLVKVEPPLAGVRVLKSSAEIGVTDATGTVFIPNLGSYQVNEVGVQPKDIPLDYTISRSLQRLRPPLRAGAIASFEVTRTRAVTGRLKLRDGPTISAIENREVVLTAVAGTARLSTIRGGDFYLENLIPGPYSARLSVEGKSCKLELTVPDTQEIVTDLGDIFCETLP